MEINENEGELVHMECYSQLNPVRYIEGFNASFLPNISSHKIYTAPHARGDCILHSHRCETLRFTLNMSNFVLLDLCISQRGLRKIRSAVL